jgi:hypothetical protein
VLFEDDRSKMEEHGINVPLQEIRGTTTIIQSGYGRAEANIG